MDGYRFEPFSSTRLPSGLTGERAVCLERHVRHQGDPVFPVVFGQSRGLGAAHEPPSRSGWGHLLEHLHLSNDAVDPVARKRVRALSALGASFNASTRLEYTSYTVEVASRHWPAVGRIVAGALSHPALDADAVWRERRVVEHEMAARNSSPSRLAATVQRGIFAGTPFAKWVSEVGGTGAALAGADAAGLSAWRAAGYGAGNAWVVVSGDVPHEAALEFAARIDLPSGGALPYPDGVWAPASGVVRVSSPATPQTSVVLSWPTVAAGDGASTALAVIERHLGGGAASRLFSELRTIRGLTYEPSIEHLQYPGVGAMEMWAETTSTLPVRSSSPKTIRMAPPTRSTMRRRPFTLASRSVIRPKARPLSRNGTPRPSE